MKPKHYFVFLICMFLINIICSCGDVFNRKQKITTNYYLLENDTREGLTLYYKTSYGDFIGRIDARVLEYGFTDSFIIAKCMTDSDLVRFYIINQKKDSDYADEKEYLKGPINEMEYKEEWAPRLKIKFTKVK